MTDSEEFYRGKDFRLVAPLHLAVHLRTSGRGAAVRNAEIGKMSGELRSEQESLSVWIL
jgi:hypothetical protein